MPGALKSEPLTVFSHVAERELAAVIEVIELRMRGFVRITWAGPIRSHESLKMECYSQVCSERQSWGQKFPRAGSLREIRCLLDHSESRGICARTPERLLGPRSHPCPQPAMKRGPQS